MDYLSGYTPLRLNKGDFKRLEKFSQIDEKDNKFINEIIEALHNEEIDCEVYGLKSKKEKKYKAVYLFKSELDKNNDKILRFEKSVIMDDLSNETTNAFEYVIYDLLSENVTVDEKWKKVIWKDKVIESHAIRIASVNLSACLFGIILGILLYVVTGQFIWFALGIFLGIGGGALVNKLGENSEEKVKKEIAKIDEKTIDKKEAKLQKKAEIKAKKMEEKARKVEIKQKNKIEKKEKKQNKDNKNKVEKEKNNK